MSVTEATSLFAYPLVSIVITSFNYASYLPTTIQSARTQTYPHVELIVIDDCSTDGTAAVLDQIERDFPAIVVVRLATNSGQTAACLEGLRVARGDYILFLDSDDALLPDCVATHLSVHLSSRRAIGFTCTDSLQVVDGRLVTARNCSISEAFLRMPQDETLTSTAALERLEREGLDLPRLDASRLRYVWPDCTDWRWSTTSCMLFRRTVLDLVMGATHLRELHIATDGYLTYISNLLSGSVLIDSAVVMYRIHGSNKSQATANLDGFANSKMDPRLFDQVLSIFSRDFVERFPVYADALDGRQKLVDVCGQIGFFCRERDPSSETTLLSRALVERRGELESVVGRDLVDGMIEHAREGWLPAIPGSPNAPQVAWSRRDRGGLRARLSNLIRRKPLDA